MSRIRTIKPELFRHEDLFDLEQRTKLPMRLSWCGLFTVCDREGRFEWRPKTLQLDILPWDNLNFEDILDAFHSKGFVRKYKCKGKFYGDIPSWKLHQVINPRERASSIPVPESGQLLAPPDFLKFLSTLTQFGTDLKRFARPTPVETCSNTSLYQDSTRQLTRECSYTDASVQLQCNESDASVKLQCNARGEGKGTGRELEGELERELERELEGKGNVAPTSHERSDANASVTHVEIPVQSQTQGFSADVPITEQTPQLSMTLPGIDQPEEDTRQRQVNEEGASPTAITWRAYAAAYEQRYGIPPVSNEKIMGQLKNFVSRIPAIEAPWVAEFYLTHSHRSYVNSGHAVGMMLLDAEKLRTEWKTGVRILPSNTAQQERNDANTQAMQNYLKSQKSFAEVSS